MKRFLVLAFIGAAACAPPAGDGQAGPNAPSPSDATARSEDQSALVPPGFGTLRQDQVTVDLRRGPLLLKVTPLHEAVIRLTAPDTYTRLHALAESRRAEAARAAGVQAPALFLVSFFSYQPDVTFQPEDVQLTHQGRQLRPLGILPVTAGWGRQLLAQQENQTAIYAFDGAIDLKQPLVVRYGAEYSDAWSGVIQVLEVELGKVRARASAPPI